MDSSVPLFASYAYVLITEVSSCPVVLFVSSTSLPATKVVPAVKSVAPLASFGLSPSSLANEIVLVFNPSGVAMLGSYTLSCVTIFTGITAGSSVRIGYGRAIDSTWGDLNSSTGGSVATSRNRPYAGTGSAV